MFGNQPKGQDIIPGIQVWHLYKVPCSGLLCLFRVQASHRPLGSLRVGPYICPHCQPILPLGGYVIVAPLHAPHKAQRCLLEAVLCQTRNTISRPPGKEFCVLQFYTRDDLTTALGLFHVVYFLGGKHLRVYSL